MVKWGISQFQWKQRECRDAKKRVVIAVLSLMISFLLSGSGSGVPLAAAASGEIIVIRDELVEFPASGVKSDTSSLVKTSDSPELSVLPASTALPAVSPNSEMQSPAVSPTSSVTPSPTATAALPEQKVIYPRIHGRQDIAEACLTFDDGYDRSSLERVLEILKKSEVKCTFFVAGDALRNYTDLWKQAVNEGHQICNHTATHRFLAGASVETVKTEINGWESAVNEVLGEEYLEKMKKEFPYFRFPGGKEDRDERLLKVINELGYIPVGWSVETQYAVLRHYNLKSADVDAIAKKVSDYVTENTKNGSIVLLHFNPYDTVKLEEMINGLRDKGLKLKTVSELLSAE